MAVLNFPKTIHFYYAAVAVTQPLTTEFKIIATHVI